MDLNEEAIKHEVYPRSWTVAASIICGGIAVICNMTILAIPFGLVLGVISLIFALGQYRKHQAAATGLLLSLFSFGILFIWILTATVVFSDPTFQWSHFLTLPISE